MKYRRVKPTGCRDIEIRKFEVVAKTQFLLLKCMSKESKDRKYSYDIFVHCRDGGGTIDREEISSMVKGLFSMAQV